MSPSTAVRSALSRYAVFRGRARRPEFWWFALFCGAVSVVAALVDQVLGARVVQTATSLALLLPSLAVSVRRLHDTGRSGWWWFVVLVPLVGWIVLLVLQCRRGDPTANRFGQVPDVPDAARGSRTRGA